MNVDVHVFPGQLLAAKTALTMEAYLQIYSSKPLLLLFSGGSAFEILNYLPPDLCGKNMTLGVLDERYSQDPRASNFLTLTGTEFFQKAVVNGCQMIDSRVKKGETLTELADRLERDLRNWKANYSDGKVVITQGIGTDGHTAGILPYPENQALFDELFEGKGRWMTGYDAGKKSQWPQRVTVTLAFLRHMVDQSFVFVSGKDKRKILTDILAEQGKYHVFPARIIHEMKSVTLCTDCQI